MEAEACACSFDGPYAEFFNEVFPKARREHVCCECREPILPGEIYQKVTGMWEGDIHTYKICLPCFGIRRDYAPCACYEMLDEEISEVLGVRLNGEIMWWAEEEE